MVPGLLADPLAYRAERAVVHQTGNRLIADPDGPLPAKALRGILIQPLKRGGLVVPDPAADSSQPRSLQTHCGVGDSVRPNGGKVVRWPRGFAASRGSAGVPVPPVGWSVDVSRSQAGHARPRRGDRPSTLKNPADTNTDSGQDTKFAVGLVKCCQYVCPGGSGRWGCVDW
jgi:hypothetical protein